MAIISTDKDQYLIKIAASEKITGKWKEAVDEIVATCKKYLGDKLISIYVGGSVASGCAVEGKSDIDTYSMVAMNGDEIREAEMTWVKEEVKRINTLFPFQRGVEIHLKPVDHITPSRKFILKVIAARVFGRDLDSDIPPYKLDRETLWSTRFKLETTMSDTRMKLDKFTAPEKIKETAAWLAKRLIRAGGLLTLLNEGVYTMDLETLRDMFLKYYPQRSEEMKKAFLWTTDAPNDKEEILTFMDSFGSWLVEEQQRVLG